MVCMKKIALLTLNGNSNYGNKLQHYGLQKYIKKLNCHVETIYFYEYKKVTTEIIAYIKGILKDLYYRRLGKRIIFFLKRISHKRYKNFKKFDRLIDYSKSYVYKDKYHCNDYYDSYVVGSDQVWNVKFHTFSKYYLLQDIVTDNKVSYSSSFGISELPNDYHKMFKDNLSLFKAISVREDKGKEIINNLGINGVEVLIDPTMLLTENEWESVSSRPKQLDKIKSDKYILNYFLGDLSLSRKKEIERVALENDCFIINLLNKNDPFYTCGPSEFLYLEKNAFLICTDSFHSSVFAILFNRPFVVFEREDRFDKMSSRIDTLINKFHLVNRKYNGVKISQENLNHDYKEAYKILEREREKSKDFLVKSLQ